MALARFMAGTLGRAIRIIAGVVLIAVGLGVVGETTGIIIAVIGVLPILAGVFNVCIIAPLIGAPFAGKDALR
jgi:hypothetical protein